MIIIKKSPTADSRTCDVAEVTKEKLLESSYLHVSDVLRGMSFFSEMLLKAGARHDNDKFTGIDQFHSDFKTKFKEHIWWNNHKVINRHHLLGGDGVPHDVNLVDVIEMIVDCVMAGMGRTGEVYPLNIDPEVLFEAFNNTIELLQKRVIVEGVFRT